MESIKWNRKLASPQKQRLKLKQSWTQKHCQVQSQRVLLMMRTKVTLSQRKARLVIPSRMVIAIELQISTTKDISLRQRSTAAVPALGRKFPYYFDSFLFSYTAISSSTQPYCLVNESSAVYSLKLPVLSKWSARSFDFLLPLSWKQTKNRKK